MKLIKKDYDEAYFNTWLEKLLLERKFNEYKINLIRSTKPSGKLFEIGCGRGKLLNELKRYYAISGIDISSSAVLEASKLIGKNHLKVLDIEKESINGKYDIILAFDVLEHLKNPSKALFKIKKSLKKNGVFIFSVPNNYGLFGKLMTSFFNYIDKTHVSTYERDKWIRIMENAGFNIEIYNEHLFGISKYDMTKYFSFNLVIVAKKNVFKVEKVKNRR